MKNLRKNLIAVTLGLAITSPLWAQESVGSGVRGGGHITEVNGQLELVDLVTTATCDWYSGDEMLTSVPEVNKIIKKIENLDWYFALELKQEIEYLSWCMTGKLYSVPAADDDSFVIQLTKGVQQAAFRYQDAAYIDQDKFSKLSPQSQAYLILHETLHSYLPMTLEMRRFKLMSLVSTVQKVDKGQINTRKALHLNFAKNELDFPLTVGRLDPHRKSLEFLLAGPVEQAQRFLKEDAPEKWLVRSNLNPLDLRSDHREAVKNPAKALRSVIEAILRNADQAQVRRVLMDQRFDRLNPASIGLGIFSELTPETQAEVLASRHMDQIVASSVRFLKSMTISLSGNRLVGNVELQSLSDQCHETTYYLTSLSVTGKCELPLEIEGLGAFIVKMVEHGQIDLLKKIVLSNAELISSIKLTSLKEKLNGMETPIRREKSLAVLVLGDLQAALVKNLKHYVKDRLCAEDYELVKPFFNEL